MARTWFTKQTRLIVIFVGAIMLPTIILGYLAIRTAETERLAVWEKLKESYTSLANVVSDQLDNMLSSAENDFRDSVSALTSHDKSSLQQLSDQLESKHKVIGQVFFLNTSGEVIFPEDTRGSDQNGPDLASLNSSTSLWKRLARNFCLSFFSKGLADEFAKIDAKVVRLVRSHRFLKNYQRLAADEITQAVNHSVGDSGFVLHLLKHTDVGPYLLSYIPDPAIQITTMAGESLANQGTTVASPDRETSNVKRETLSDIALAGFEVNLNYLASQGFKEVLSDLTVKDDVVLAILNENNEIFDFRFSISDLKLENGSQQSEIKDQKPKILLTTVTSSSLPFWKVGVYLKEPHSLEELSKRKATLRVFVIVGLTLAIAFGIYLALREARREAELARLRSDFVSNVSHELRTPLSSIQIFSETLRQNKITGRDKQEQYLDTISSESERLARLVDNVLDFSRLERRTKDFKFRPINVGEVVTSSVETYRFYAEQRGATIRLDIARGLPEIEADSEAISQMVINLVDNAVKYSGDEGEITVRVFRRGNNIVIQVADKGVGIDKEDMKRIFDKFYRGKNAANLGTGGTGLGLTLAKAVAEAHGGDILVRSKKGVGSRFSVILPLTVISNQ